METISIKIKRTVKEGTEALKCFGARIAFSKIRCIWKNDSLESIKKKNTDILSYLKKEYSGLLERYASASNPRVNVEAGSEPIWVFWLQGKKQMPQLIQMCLQSKETHSGGHPVILLDDTNIREYVSFPEEVWKKAEAGTLKVQHLADMIRVQLIRKYGGLWLDASVFCHKNIDERAYSLPVFSLKGDYMPQFISGNRWTTFVLGGCPDNVLCRFLDDFFLAWIQSGKPFIDYFMLDCAIALAYENIPAVRADIDVLPVSEGDCYWLNRRIDMPINDELLREYALEPSTFYKIGWNRALMEEDDTFYSYLLKNNLNQ